MEPTSGHWLTGLWKTIEDFGIYIAVIFSTIWGVGMFSLRSLYVTKKELNEKLNKIEEKNDAQHEIMSTKIDQVKDLLILHFSNNGDKK